MDVPFVKRFFGWQNQAAFPFLYSTTKLGYKLNTSLFSGAYVIGTTNTKEKAERATASGTDEVVKYSEVDFVEEVKRITDGGVKVVYDGGGNFRKRQVAE